MRIEVHGTGPGVAELGHVDDLPDELRDPMQLFVDLINAGFVVPDQQAVRRQEQPRVALSNTSVNAERTQVEWWIESPGLRPDHLSIAKNLLGMRAIEATFDLVEQNGRDSIRSPLPVADFELPRLDVPVPFEFKMELDESVPVRGCTIYVQYRAELDKAHAQQLCRQFSIWGNVAMCGGFTPPDADPAMAGTLFCAAFQHDPNTIALEFEECFAIDFASFDLIKSFLLQSRDIGGPVVDVIVE